MQPSQSQASPLVAAPLQKPAEPRLGVVSPLANEEGTLDEFFRRVLAQLGPDDLIFCVVDNASRDATRAMVEAASERDPRVRLVWAPENRCVVDAYFRGYREALDAGCRWVLEMDGGLSHPPEMIPRFIEAMEQGYDFAAGSRFAPGGNYSGPLKRWAISRCGTALANMLLRTRMHDMTSGFECFTRETLGRVVARGVRSRAHFFQTEIRFMLRGSRWTEVPIRYHSPSSTVGSASLRESLGNLWRLYQDRRREEGRGIIEVKARDVPAAPEAVPCER